MVTQRNLSFRAFLFAFGLCAVPLLCRCERPPRDEASQRNAPSRPRNATNPRGEPLADTEAGFPKRDPNGRLDPYEAYERSALLLRIQAGRSGPAGEEAAVRAAVAFDRMARRARRDLRRIEREIAGYAEAESGPARGSAASLRELVERKRATFACTKDPLQVQRMLGDHYFSSGDPERALLHYERFYRDLEKPPSAFAPQSMRNFVALLSEWGMTEDALRMQGFIVNLGPHMFPDLARLAEMYCRMGDGVSCLLFLMLLNTAADGVSVFHYRESRELLLRLAAELGLGGCGEHMRDLVLAFATGGNLRSIAGIAAELEEEGVRHFFLDYLEGVSHFAAREYPRALECFEAFNEVYPYLAESHCYAMVCMVKIDSAGYGEAIARSGEGAVALKPGSLAAALAKRTLARLAGLGEDEAERLLLPSEAVSIIEGFTRRGAPPESLQRLLDGLSVSRDPYRFATMELMARVENRRDEFVSYLKSRSARLDGAGRRNVREVLARMGEEP